MTDPPAGQASGPSVPPPAGPKGGAGLVIRPNGARRLCEFEGCTKPRTCLWYCLEHHEIVCMRTRRGVWIGDGNG